jgi:hypothetical protein
VFAAIWAKYSMASSCAGVVNWQMTFTNGTTGAVDVGSLVDSRTAVISTKAGKSPVG